MVINVLDWYFCESIICIGLYIFVLKICIKIVFEVFVFIINVNGIMNFKIYLLYVEIYLFWWKILILWVYLFCLLFLLGLGILCCSG